MIELAAPWVANSYVGRVNMRRRVIWFLRTQKFWMLVHLGLPAHRFDGGYILPPYFFLALPHVMNAKPQTRVPRRSKSTLNVAREVEAESRT